MPNLLEQPTTSRATTFSPVIADVINSAPESPQTLVIIFMLKHRINTNPALLFVHGDGGLCGTTTVMKYRSIIFLVRLDLTVTERANISFVAVLEVSFLSIFRLFVFASS